MDGARRALFDQGMAVRRQVLGDDHVNRSMAQASEFSMPVQELVTEYCWGAVWSRPGLERRIRSLINIGMLTVLNRPQELQAHVRGALNTGCTPEEIQEALLQAAVYAGMPAGIDAFRSAEAVLSGSVQPPPPST